MFPPKPNSYIFKVAGSRKLDDGSTKDYDVIFAWITIYEKQDDEWKRLIEVSTNN